MSEKSFKKDYYYFWIKGYFCREVEFCDLLIKLHVIYITIKSGFGGILKNIVRYVKKKGHSIGSFNF